MSTYHLPMVGRAASQPATARRRRTIVWLATALLLLSACSSSTDGESSLADEIGDQIAAVSGDEVDQRTVDLVEHLRARDLESLASAVEQLSITDLTDGNEYTLLAPNDEAFIELDGDESAQLSGDPERLSEILRSHLVPRRLDAAALSELDSVQTVSGKTLRVEAHSGEVSIGDAKVVAADLEAPDGIIHVIDRILTS